MPRPARLTHADEEGRLRMVDVGGKAVTEREAVASAHVALAPATRRAVASGRLKKGNPLQAARLAGVMAAKRTSDLIPLCHPLVLTGIDVELTPTSRGIAIRAAVRTTGQTGVEMEALTAVAVAALTVYDMLKAIDKGMVIEDVQLEEKRGGRSGHYRRAARPARSRAR
ncbi:MAG: cyclic pyranopterin monophosphate synthase MoaC [Acidobacteria bacterium]|nr:cyclic pyranopterin monophosphate synthase MoaC [Acidobacteriota bacterium]